MLSQVVVRRSRLCVAVKAGRQSDLPKGSMTLATSSTGLLPSGNCAGVCNALLQRQSQLCRLGNSAVSLAAACNEATSGAGCIMRSSLMLSAGSTIYMDPEPTVALNNAEAMLSGQEDEEEARILAALSALVAAQSARIWDVSLLAFLLTVAVTCIKHGWRRKPFCDFDLDLHNKLAGTFMHAYPILQPCSMHITLSMHDETMACADTQRSHSTGRLRSASRARGMVWWEPAMLSGAWRGSPAWLGAGVILVCMAARGTMQEAMYAEHCTA